MIICKNVILTRFLVFVRKFNTELNSIQLLNSSGFCLCNFCRRISWFIYEQNQQLPSSACWFCNCIIISASCYPENFWIYNLYTLLLWSCTAYPCCTVVVHSTGVLQYSCAKKIRFQRWKINGLRKRGINSSANLSGCPLLRITSISFIIIFRLWIYSWP